MKTLPELSSPTDRWRIRQLPTSLAKVNLNPCEIALALC